jgi:hypothetical protein
MFSVKMVTACELVDTKPNANAITADALAE